MPSFAISPFRRSLPSNPETSAVEYLARAMLSDQGPTKSQLHAFQRVVGWRPDAQGKDTKGNYHAYQLLKREMKRLNGGNTLVGAAHDRLERYFMVPTRMKIEHKAAKRALRERQSLNEMIHTLERRLEQVEQERSEDLAAIEAERKTFRERRERLRHSLIECMSDDTAPVFPALEQVRTPRHSLRNTGQRTKRLSLCEHISSRPALPTDELTTQLASGVVHHDTPMQESAPSA